MEGRDPSYILRIDKHWGEACQTSPLNSYTAFITLILSVLLMFSLSGICRDKVPPL